MAHESEKDLAPAGGQMPPAPPRNGFAVSLRSPGAKFLMIGFISMVLLVPLLLVWALTEERASRAEDVSGRIASGWGGDQVVNGPYLAVPFDVERRREVNGQSIVDRTTEWALVMPETLDVTADLKTEEKRLSIYSLPVYNGDLVLKGRFGAGILQDLARFSGTPRLDSAILVLSIQDMTGIRSSAGVRIDGGSVLPFDPGMRDISVIAPRTGAQDMSIRSDAGVHRSIERGLVEKGFDFDIAFSLNGSGSFAVAPAGQTTSLAAKANWPHPGFEGLFLPEEKTVTASDFTANWTIPYLARGIDRVVESSRLPLTDSLMRINLVEPVKFYQIIARTLKYSIGFISLVFLAVFIVELRGGSSVHWIQYVLTGLALIVFYVLLLALAEHTGFTIAYAAASLLTALLISSYLGSATDSRQNGIALFTVLAVAYGVMYLVLNEDEYALLAGALISFIAIAATMFATRRVDWSGTGPTQHNTNIGRSEAS
ncbi:MULTISPECIES: cell envelope integrity protein CreD [Rhizobium/Agrobacterium group]|jgi:inner membrane protein|uniref:cell envelope integrity protein CreD n=1 Tax=Rhizobium/Agrobacterium group TaxID=227290 RepID=UPI00023A51D7|nr:MULTISPECIES: cell envelope integrity protein CreD [unclassified Rhizobium]EHJ99498.1 inner membrane protein [Agrobacterium tumefaciens 5A]MDP9559119.1 inner membrane protein [Rhizobium nepotum]TWC89494.1 inner membrane protein [Rhizobium sp. SJZ105]UXU04544.1 cell envelope integrity protein CreD [Agrobacterium tumefaciens]